MSELRHDNWAGTTYGTKWMHKWLIKLLRCIDIRILYAFAYVFVVPPSIVFRGFSRKSTYAYFRNQFGFGKLKSWRMVFKNHYQFAQVIIDRFAMYSGHRFDIELDGYEQFQQLASCDSGFVQLSSHIGNYELAGYSLKADRKRFNALIFAGEKEVVMDNRLNLFAGNNIRMIPMREDMSHLFEIDRLLSDGEILSMPADRIFGSQKFFTLNFLRGEAKFPQGPFMVAAMKDLPVLFVAVMKKNHKTYKIHIRRISPPIDSKDNTRTKARKLAEAYCCCLEGTMRLYPTQWYNYYDFWA